MTLVTTSVSVEVRRSGECVYPEVGDSLKALVDGAARRRVEHGVVDRRGVVSSGAKSTQGVFDLGGE
ncbi:hypothetical protein ACIBG0_29500 [Nocardia sp. NPDC050630]|uniref:hypothetical protein n=1 Tax=Nocardia sp. NPDC050630 TaxID=3364321 RepID=UPI0037B33C28